MLFYKSVICLSVICVLEIRLIRSRQIVFTKIDVCFSGNDKYIIQLQLKDILYLLQKI